MSRILQAIFAGKRELAEELAAGCDLDLAEATALDRGERVREILAADPAAARGFAADGFTALHYAAHLGYAGIARQLIAAGADVAAVARHAIDATPLHSAVAGRQTAIAAILLDAGAPIDATYEKGSTALHAAAAAGDLATVRLLVERGANLALTDAAGKSARDVAKGEAAAYLGS